LKSISGKELSRAVERQGWKLLRIAGGHHIYGKEGSIVRLSIPIRQQATQTGLLRHLLALAEIGERDV
jgi:predicted RNA binding protein YcfA (HicA-like mRNA interferase family)